MTFKQVINTAGAFCSIFLVGLYIYEHELMQALPWGLLFVYQLGDALEG